MKLIVVSPFGMTKFHEALNSISSWGESGNLVRSKNIIVNEELAQKLFSFLSSERAELVVEEWTGAMVFVALVKEVGADAEELMAKSIIYVSPEERADRETHLFFPEYFL
jgi:hypothetical protein